MACYHFVRADLMPEISLALNIRNMRSSLVCASETTKKELSILVINRHSFPDIGATSDTMGNLELFKLPLNSAVALALISAD